MDNHEWLYFLTIAEEGYLTKAAQKLFVSQPALSQYLNKLEKRLETKLFERNPNNALVLTPAGNRYRRYCQDALQLWETARREMHSQGIDSTLVWGMCSYKYEKIMDEYCRSTPETAQIMIQRLSAPELPQKLLSGEIQLAYGTYFGEHPQLHYRCLRCREVDLVVPWDHPLASRSYLISGNENVRIRLGEIGDLPLALLTKPQVWRQRVEAYFKKVEFTPNVAMEVKTDEDLWQIAAQEHLATFYYQRFERGKLPPGTMPVALDPPMYATYGVFYRKNQEFSPVVMRAIEHLCASYQQ